MSFQFLLVTQLPCFFLSLQGQSHKITIFLLVKNSINHLKPPKKALPKSTADQVKAGPLKGNFIRSCADAVVDDGRMVGFAWLVRPQKDL